MKVLIKGAGDLATGIAYELWKSGYEILMTDIAIDAIMAKRNTGTRITDASMVIGIGPGFCAGQDCHYAIETKRGPHLGKIIRQGEAIPNTGIPGTVGGYTIERLLRATADGEMKPVATIGDVVVTKGMKIGDIDARIEEKLCYTISDKAHKIGRSVVKLLD